MVSGGLGYPSVSPMFKDAGLRGSFGSGVPVGVEFGDVQACDRAVNRLPIVLRCVVIQHYQMQSSLRDTARVCGISHKSAKQYLGMAHRAISESFEHDSIGA